MLGAVYRFYPEMSQLIAPRQELAAKERRVAKYREQVKEAEGLKHRLKTLEEALAKGEAVLLTGKTPSLAAADIQNILQKAAEKCGVKISTVRVLKPEGAEKEIYVSVPVEFTTTSTIAQLKELLYLIESHPKYLKITKVRSRTAAGGRRLPQGKTRGGIAQAVVEQIRSDITVSGFYKKEAAGPES